MRSLATARETVLLTVPRLTPSTAATSASLMLSLVQLKIIQEVITLSVFSVFSVAYLGEKLKWNYAAGFACMVLGVFFVFHKW